MQELLGYVCGRLRHNTREGGRMSRIGNEYPEEYYDTVNFDCDNCGIINEDIEVLVTGGFVSAKCKICNYTNEWESE